MRISSGINGPGVHRMEASYRRSLGNRGLTIGGSSGGSAVARGWKETVIAMR
jgi:Asp-tRNA(Asn)/Glu-tRNA(Gln) amidotransferase A subunit family amidase